MTARFEASHSIAHELPGGAVWIDAIGVRTYPVNQSARYKLDRYDDLK